LGAMAGGFRLRVWKGGPPDDGHRNVRQGAWAAEPGSWSNGLILALDQRAANVLERGYVPSRGIAQADGGQQAVT
jgi:hypothetical protein